jgi:putative phage-type endonuclease
MTDPHLIADNTVITPRDRQRWLAQRNKSLGGSDAAVIAGITGSRLKLWLEKTGKLEAKDEPNEAMQWGLLLEDDIAEMIERRTSNAIARTQVFRRHPDCPWLTATLDGVGLSQGEIYEFKACGTGGHGARLGDDGEIESLPEQWILQAHHQMLVARQTMVRFAVFGPDLALRMYPLPFDEELGDHLFELEQDFWFNHVVANVPPAEFSHGDAAALTDAYRSMDDVWLVLGHDATRAAMNYQALGAQIRDLEARREAERARLLLEIGNAAGADLMDGWSVQRKVIEVSSHTVKASSQVRLFIKEPKEPS